MRHSHTGPSGARKDLFDSGHLLLVRHVFPSMRDEHTFLFQFNSLRAFSHSHTMSAFDSRIMPAFKPLPGLKVWGNPLAT